MEYVPKTSSSLFKISPHAVLQVVTNGTNRDFSGKGSNPSVTVRDPILERRLVSPEKP
jgi:hypothetical protein